MLFGKILSELQLKVSALKFEGSEGDYIKFYDIDGINIVLLFSTLSSLITMLKKTMLQDVNIQGDPSRW